MTPSAAGGGRDDINILVYSIGVWNNTITLKHLLSNVSKQQISQINYFASGRSVHKIQILSIVKKCLLSLLSALHAFFAFIDVSSNVIEWHTSPATLCKSRNTEFGDVSACNRFLLILHQFIVHIQNQFHFVRLWGIN